MQATYNYEAFATVLSNAFSKNKKIDWRTKTYSEEYEENNLPYEEKRQKALKEFGDDMDRRYKEFQRAKAQNLIEAPT